MAGNKNSGNWSSVEILDYKELLELSVKHLTMRMKSEKTSDEAKDKIATLLVGKAMPQTLQHTGEVISEHIYKLEGYGVTDTDIESYADGIVSRRQRNSQESPAG